jgi:hypothetical protein
MTYSKNSTINRGRVFLLLFFVTALGYGQPLEVATSNLDWNGTGLAGSFPPLKGSPHAKGNKDDLIRIVLQGLRNETTGRAPTYDAAMPGFKFLSDTEVADVVSYVRTVFGEQQEGVTAADVARLRGEDK